MGKTIIHDKKQEVSIGSFGKDSSGVSPEEVSERLKNEEKEEVNNDDTVNNVNKVDNENKENSENDVDSESNENKVDDVNNVNKDDNVNNENKVDSVNEKITLSEEFKAKFDIQEFEEIKILEKIKTLEDEKLALILEKETLQRDNFIKEKGITKEVFEALSGNTFKEKEEALKKITKLSGFKLNSSNDIKKIHKNIVSAF